MNRIGPNSQRLLLEAVEGDATLFIRRDEVETAWALWTPSAKAGAMRH